MKKLGSILFMAFVAALLFGALYVLRWLKTPLDPPLELSLPARAQPAAGSLQAQAATPTPKPSKKTCGDTGQMSLLVSGVSMLEWRPQHGVGALRLVTVNFDDSSAGILDLPRALYVDAAHLQLPDQTSLTVIYRIARDAAQGNNPDEINRKATQDMAQVLVDDFGYVPDHYLTVDPQKFIDLVDTLGGIDIDLSAPIDGRPDHLGYFESGPLHLDGARALDLLRILHPAGETNPNVWQKFERQRIVVLALLQTMLKPDNWAKLPDVVKDARQMVVTDLSASQALNLLCMVQETKDSTDFQVVPDTQVEQISDEKILITDLPALTTLLQTYTSTKK